MVWSVHLERWCMLCWNVDQGLKDGKGAFYPKGIKLPATQEVYVNALRKKGLLSDFKRLGYGSRILHSSSVGMENMKVNGIQSGRLISLKRSYTQNASLERRGSFELAVEKVVGHDMTKDIAESSAETDTRATGGNVPILEREYMQGVLLSELVVENAFPSSSNRDKRQQKKLDDIKRPGETIIKGHRSYDLMLSLQLGIR
ncbi:putative 1-phosphatidylinositol-4-phosphate 5-kinase [Dioscorea sansibarensis]